MPRPRDSQSSHASIDSCFTRPSFDEKKITVRSRSSSSVAKPYDDIGNYADMPHVAPGCITGCIVQHWLFRHSITGIVVLGALQMGFETAFEGPVYKQAWEIWHVFYTVVSTIEMICMIESYRTLYFTTGWMLVDFMLAVASILSTFVLPTIPIGRLPGSAILRNLRLLRVIRIIKVTKVFPGFAVIVDGLMDSFLSMFWIFALLFLIFYASGVFCVEMLGGDDAGYPAYNEVEVRSQVVGTWNNYIYFGTLRRSMVTLLGMFLLSEWGLIREIAEVNLYIVPFFLFLLVVVTFGVLNVIIGIVVEKTIAVMNKPRRDEQLRDAQHKAAVREELSSMFDYIDADSDGRISLSEMELNLQLHPTFARRLQNLDLPYNFTMVEFMGMLDSNGNGVLNKNEFVAGLMRMMFSNTWQRECLHAMEIGMLRQDVQRIANDLTKELRGSVDGLKSQFRAVMRAHGVRTASETSRCCHSPGTLSPKITRENVLSSDIGARSLKDWWEPVPDNIPVTVVCAHCKASMSTKVAGKKKVDMRKVKKPRAGIDPAFETVSLETDMWAQFPHFPQTPVRGSSDGVGCGPLIDRDDAVQGFAVAGQQKGPSAKSSLCSYDVARSQPASLEPRAVGKVGF